jgi:hypothetical protein
VILRKTTPFWALTAPKSLALVLLATQCVFIIVLPTKSKDYWERLIIPISQSVKIACWNAIWA